MEWEVGILFMLGLHKYRETYTQRDILWEIKTEIKTTPAIPSIQPPLVNLRRKPKLSFPLSLSAAL